jgi:ABC-2 type transport system ATP-binding protein
MDFISASGGNCEIFGIDSRDPRSRAPVGFLPEVFSFDGFLRGEKFLRMFGRLGNRARGQIEEAIPELLEFLDMPGARRQKIKSYSKGMTQKIGLAQALIGDPDLLILDEPTSGMDPIAKIKIKNLLKKLRAEGKTIFLSTHILSDIEDIADQVVIIDQGELLAVDKLDNLLRSDVQSYRIQFTGGGEILLNRLSDYGDVKRVGEGRHEVFCSDAETKDTILKFLLDAKVDITLLRPSGATLEHRFLQLLQREELSDD